MLARWMETTAPRLYEHQPAHFLAFTAIATSLINYRRLASEMTSKAERTELRGPRSCGWRSVRFSG